METDSKVKGPGRQEELHERSPKDVIDRREPFALLVRKWKFLLQVTIGGGVSALLIALLVPNMYTGTALILPPTKPQSLSSLLMAQMGGVAGAAAPSLGMTKDPNETYIGILRCRTATDDLVRQFGLQQVYSKKTNEEARRKLLDRASFSLGRDSMIKISVKDHDPQRAAMLANAFITELNKQNNRLAVTESGQRRMFFEREVEAEKNALASAEIRLKETQQRTGVVEASSQSQVVIGSIAKMRAEIAMQEVSLERFKMGATAENPEVGRQQTELSALRFELSKLEAGNSRQRSGDPFVPQANAPQARLEYLRALREMKYHDMLFEVLSKQFEAARIDEAKEAPVIQVVDLAVPPERRSGPPRTQITFLGVIVSAMGAAMFVYLSHREAPIRPPP